MCKSLKKPQIKIKLNYRYLIDWVKGVIVYRALPYEGSLEITIIVPLSPQLKSVHSGYWV